MFFFAKNAIKSIKIGPKISKIGLFGLLAVFWPFSGFFIVSFFNKNAFFSVFWRFFLYKLQKVRFFSTFAKKKCHFFVKKWRFFAFFPILARFGPDFGRFSGKSAGNFRGAQKRALFWPFFRTFLHVGARTAFSI